MYGVLDRHRRADAPARARPVQDAQVAVGSILAPRATHDIVDAIANGIHDPSPGLWPARIHILALGIRAYAVSRSVRGVSRNYASQRANSDQWQHAAAAGFRPPPNRDRSPECGISGRLRHPGPAAPRDVRVPIAQATALGYKVVVRHVHRNSDVEASRCYRAAP